MKTAESILLAKVTNQEKTFTDSIVVKMIDYTIQDFIKTKVSIYDETTDFLLMQQRQAIIQFRKDCQEKLFKSVKPGD